MITEDAQASCMIVRLLFSLMAAGRLAVSVLMGASCPAAVPGLLSEGSDEDCFDGVEAVFGLVEDDAGG
jgi:hypothetical protein